MQGVPCSAAAETVETLYIILSKHFCTNIAIIPTDPSLQKEGVAVVVLSLQQTRDY